MKIFLIGPQGSGKSTQSKLLADFLKVVFIETGEIFREISRGRDDLGKKVKELLQKGEMVSDDVASQLVEKRLKAKDCQNGFVMNGYPRSLNQIKLFDPGFDKVFYLKISDEEGISRLVKRARDDDSLELIKKRLADYHRLTKPLLDHYIFEGILEEIDGSGTIEEIQQRLRSSTHG